MPPDKEPTQDQLLAMAYADGELHGEQQHAFEARLGNEPDLALEISHYRELELLARQVAPPEPADFEWKRLRTEPVQRVGNAFGWILFVTGAVGLGAWGLISVAVSDMGIVPKVLTLALETGLLVLLLLTVHRRLRLLPHDVYRKVQR